MKNAKCALLSCIFWLGFALPARGQAVRIREGSIEIPTYALGEEDPNPPFPLADRHRVYPYTMLDNLTDKLETKSYRAVYLENEFLKLIVLPDLGGRVYSLYDKVNRREVFYRNNVVKYGLVALRGAWISGGIEFNFPDGHTVVTVSPVASTLRQNPDGSAAVVVGDVDQVTGMHWEIALTLRPRQARLEQGVTLFNATAQPQLYWFWANAAVPATDDMQFIYPMREAYPHVRGVVWNFPMHDGADISWYKNIRQPTSLFARQVHRSFFGAYYHQSDCGVVHVADYHELPGKKIWSWGVAGDGLIWTGLLTDRDGPYNEIQSGRYQTQLNYEFMPPRQVESWREYWYPVQGLGDGFVEATSQLALNVNFFQASAAGKPRVTLALFPTLAMTGVKVRVTLGARVLRELGPLTFEPMKTVRVEVPVENLQEAKSKLGLEVESADGQGLLHWSALDPVDGNLDFVPAAGVAESPSKPVEKVTVEELFLRGEEQEKEGREGEAEGTYQAVLERDPNYIPALLKLAWRNYRAGDFPRAEGRIYRALARNSFDPRVHYAGGVIYRASERWTLSQDAFWAAIHYGGPPAPSLSQLGEISIRQKQYVEAAGLLRRALSYNPDDALALADLAVALRLAGKTPEASEAVERALGIMPLLPFALAEQWRLASASSQQAPSTPGRVKATPQFSRPGLQDSLDAAAWYFNLDDLASAHDVLRAALDVSPHESVSPLVAYYLAAIERRWKQAEQADKSLARAAQAPSDKVFPNRLADARVLDEALVYNPLDAHAKYFLGNFLFAQGRYDDAATLWSHALGEGFEFSVLMRNLGLYAWRVKKDLAGAVGFYENAVRLAPADYHLYVDLDEIYFRVDNTPAREKLFARAPESVRSQDTVLVRLALLETQESHYERALELLMNHHFKPWEGGEIVREMFLVANVQMGRQALEAEKFSAAEKAFRQALEYPPNFGVGKPDKPHDEEALYWLGESLAAQGKADAAAEAWRAAAAEGAGGSGPSSLYRGLALRRLGQTEEADKLLAALAEAARAEKPGAEDYYLAGLLDLFENRKDQAKNFLRSALETDPSLWQARIELARAGR